MTSKYQTVPQLGSNERLTAEVIRGLMNGKSNNTGSVTLATGGVTSTTFYDERIGYDSVIVLSPSNAAASSIFSSSYIVTTNKGNAILNHSANTTASVIYKYIVVG